MSQILQININNPTNFIIDDPDKIEIDSNGGRLLRQKDSHVFQQNFDNDTGFTYDNTKAEFVGGKLQQKDQRPANSILASTFETSLDANWGADGFIDLSANLNGTPVLSGGKVDCIGSNGLYYKDTLIGGLSGNFVIKFKYTPHYTGTPSNNSNIVTISQDSGTTDIVLIFHSSVGGGIRITANGLSASSFAVWSPTAEQEYVFEVICINNEISIYIDNAQIGTSKTISPGQGTSSNRLWIGAFSSVYNNANAEYDDLILYSTASQTSTYIIPSKIYTPSIIEIPKFSHVGTGFIDSLDTFETIENGTLTYNIKSGSKNYQYFNGGGVWLDSNGTLSESTSQSIANTNIAGYTDVFGELDVYIKIFLGEDSNTQSYIDQLTIDHTDQENYATDDPYFSLNTSIVSIRADQLFDFLEDVSENDDIKYVLGRNGEKVYWNGSAWVNSDLSLLQSNSVLEILTGKEEFLTEGDGKQINIYWILHSDDGLTTPEADSVTIEYDFSAEPPTLNENIIYSFLYTLDGLTAEKFVTVQTIQYIIGTNSIITSDPINIEIRENASFEAKLYIEDVEPDELLWNFDGKKIRTNFLAGINKFSDLTILERC
jgi:hypothetical protein